MLYACGHCVASDATAFYRNHGAMSSDQLSDSGSEYVPGFCDEEGSDNTVVMCLMRIVVKNNVVIATLL